MNFGDNNYVNLEYQKKTQNFIFTSSAITE